MKLVRLKVKYLGTIYNNSHLMQLYKGDTAGKKLRFLPVPSVQQNNQHDDVAVRWMMMMMMMTFSGGCCCCKLKNKFVKVSRCYRFNVKPQPW